MNDKLNTAHDILGRLEQEGLLADAAGAGGFLQPSQRVWYLEAALALAAFIAALLLMVFIASLGFLNDSYAVWIFLGAVHIGIALALYRLANTRFFDYMALAISLGGLGMVLVGWNLVSESYGQVVVLNGLMVALVLAFRDKLLHFLWFMVFLGNALIWLAIETPQIGVPLMALAALAGTVFLFSQHQKHDELRPLAYALAFAAIAASMVFLWPAVVSAGGNTLSIEGWWFWLAVKIGALAVMGSYLWLTAGSRRVWIFWVPMAALALVAWFTTPPVMVALCLLMMAYAFGEAWLFGLAGLAFGYAIGVYYYDLSVSLLLKSGYLAAVGSTLLLLRFLLKRAGVLAPLEATNEV